MGHAQDITKIRALGKSLPALLLATVLPLGFSAVARAQQEEEEEIVANLAAGRVFIWVAQDGIVIGAAAERAEPGSLPPLMVPLTRQRIGILLGAVEWLSPATGRATILLDRELAQAAGATATATLPSEPGEAPDLSALGVAFLERLRVAAGQLHRKVELKPDEPLVELLLLDYLEGYGPEVWSLRYRIAQQELRGGFWQTRVLRPSYAQLYPPEKGQSRTLIEVCYPLDQPEPPLLELIRKNDPRVARIPSGDSATTRAAERLARDQANKSRARDAAAYLRALLGAVTPADQPLVLGVLYEEKPMEWLLAPPERPAVKAEEQGKPREPSAPSLRRKPPR